MRKSELRVKSIEEKMDSEYERENLLSVIRKAAKKRYARVGRAS
jgi:hypothetical protein